MIQHGRRNATASKQQLEQAWFAGVELLTDLVLGSNKVKKRAHRLTGQRKLPERAAELGALRGQRAERKQGDEDKKPLGAAAPQK